MTPLYNNFPNVPDVMEGCDYPPFIKKKLPAKSGLENATDVFILLASFLLTITSIVLVALIFHAQATNPYSSPQNGALLSILQRIISSLSLTVTSAVTMMAGKRYVLFKLTRGGFRSQRVAVYSNPTIGNLTSYLVLYGAELPLLGLSIVWGLALATSLTVNSSWEMGPLSALRGITVPSGSLDRPASSSSLVIPALEQLTFVMSAWCLGLADAVGLIHIIGANVITTVPMQLAGLSSIYYPPLPISWNRGASDYSFSVTSQMNGFNISLETLSSVPPTARNISNCAQSLFLPPTELWLYGSDNQTLSIIVATEGGFDLTQILQINATMIIMGGTLSSYDNYTEFALNGTSWPNVMSTGNQWAEDIIGLVCNATLPQPMGSFSSDLSLPNFVIQMSDGYLDPFSCWISVLDIALGAYSAAMLSPGVLNDTAVLNVPENSISVTFYGAQFRSTYAIYILLANIIASVTMLIIVVRLRLASHLGPDFLNSTRLLLDPLKKPELFNASLQTTVDTFSDPYMLVVADSMYLFARNSESEKTGSREGDASRALSLST